MKFGCSELFFEHLPRIDSCERFDIVFGFLHKDYAVSCPSVNQLTVTTELARFPGDLPADPRHVLVYEDPRTLQFAPVSHDRTLGVVAGERGDDIARCRLVVPRPPYPVGAHDVMGVDLHAYASNKRANRQLKWLFPRVLRADKRTINASGSIFGLRRH